MIVLDASAAIEVVLQSPAAAAVEARLFRSGETLHVPHLIDLEVAQVLRRYLLKKQIDLPRSRAALADWLAFPVSRYPHDALLPRVWDLRDNFTAYDAAYIALAEALGAPLVTRDTRLGTAGHGARIEVV